MTSPKFSQRQHRVQAFLLITRTRGYTQDVKKSTDINQHASKTNSNFHAGFGPRKDHEKLSGRHGVGLILKISIFLRSLRLPFQSADFICRRFPTCLDLNEICFGLQFSLLGNVDVFLVLRQTFFDSFKSDTHFAIKRLLNKESKYYLIFRPQDGHSAVPYSRDFL